MSRPARRLIVCCDGTWEDADSEKEVLMDTNVTHIFRLLLQEGRTSTGEAIEQVKTYQAGVGSGEGRMLGTYHAGLGSGMLERVKKLYMDFLVPNWQVGDEVFLVGFSRGAATVRLLLNLIDQVGIMDTPEWMDTFPRLFELLPKGDGPQSNSHTRKLLHDALSSNDIYKSRQDNQLEGRCIVKVCAVFETVSTRGRPTELRSHAMTESFFEYDAFGLPTTQLPLCLEMGYQALALDEVRDDFKPDVWRQRVDAPGGQKLLQMWFSGIHTNVGGGELTHELSDIALMWMIAQLAPHLAFDEARLARIGPTAALAPWGQTPPHKLPSWQNKLHTSPRSLPTALDASSNQRLHLSVRFQPSLRPDIALLVHSHPELFLPLLPLEEALKRRWAYVGVSEESSEEEAPARMSWRPLGFHRTQAVARVNSLPAVVVARPYPMYRPRI